MFYTRHWSDVGATIAFGGMHQCILFAIMIPTCLHNLNVLGLRGQSCRLCLQRGFVIAWSKLPHSFAMCTSFKHLLLIAHIQNTKTKIASSMATPEPSPKKARSGLGRLANAPTPPRPIKAVNDVLVCVICEKTSKSQDPGRPGHSLAFPRKPSVEE